MSLRESIREKTGEVIRENKGFKIAPVSSVPSYDDERLTFGNTGLVFDAAVLFIDMRRSTKILNILTEEHVAILHMVFFHAIAKICREEGGEIRSFNGDATLVFFHGDNDQDAIRRAVKSAMRIKFIFIDRNGLGSMLRKSILKKFKILDFGIGIDYGRVVCTKVGIGGKDDNKDIFWIGNCVNKSSKYADGHKDPNFIAVSERVYEKLPKDLIYDYGENEKNNIWTRASFKYNDKNEVYYYTKFGYIMK